RVPEAGGGDHGGLSHRVHALPARAFFEQDFYEVGAARETRRHQGGHARKVREIHVRAPFDGEPRHVSIAVLERDEKQRVAQAVARIHRRAPLQKALRRGKVALSRRNKKLSVGGKILSASGNGGEKAKGQSEPANQRLSPAVAHLA